MDTDNDIVFSVIIPAKNEENYIEKCINGITPLDFDDGVIEIIVVNNNSTDKTKVIAIDLGAKVIDVEEGTISELRNLGAKEAKGDILAFIDADCIPQKDWLKNALVYFKDSKVACVGSEPVLRGMEMTWVEKAWTTMKMKPYTLETKWLSSCNFIIRKKVFEEIRGFDPSLKTCEDVDIGYRISAKWTLMNAPSVAVVHLREPKTIVDFFKKELWHGASNFLGLFKHGLVFQELPSLLIPVWTIMCFIGLAIGVYFLSIKLFMICILAFFLQPLGLTIKVIRRTREITQIFPIFVLFVIYCIARGIAIFK